MKAYLLSCLFIFITGFCQAQNTSVSALPSGKYETIIKTNQNKWDRGDIVILADNKYKLTTSDEIGEYKFSVSAQRVFFTSGPMKGLFARTSLDNNIPAIVLPVSENEQFGLKLPSEVWCYHRQ